MIDLSHPRVGYCCKYVPPDGNPETTRLMNQIGVTMTGLGRLERTQAMEKMLAVVDHNIAALERQLANLASRPSIERLLRISSGILPAYTHETGRWIYRAHTMRELVESGLARAGELARSTGIRIGMHPGQFCVMSTASESSLRNAIDELEYHVDVMRWMGFTGDWHPGGAHINVHGGARGPGIATFRANMALLSEDARNLLTVENDEVSYGLDDLLPLADALPVVLDLHHHWIFSRGEYIQPDDPRIAVIRQSWRGIRPIAHVSAPLESLLSSWPTNQLPDFQELMSRGVKPRDLRSHSDLMNNTALNDLVIAHMAWADFEVETKLKNLASAQIAEQFMKTETRRNIP